MNSQDTPPLRQGQLFTAAAPSPVSQPPRPAQTYTPQTAPLEPPTAITAEPKIQAPLQQLQLEALPITGLKYTLFALGIGLLGLIAWPVTQALDAAFSWHPLWGLTSLMFFSLLSGLCGYSVYQLWSGRRALSQVTQLQQLGDKLKPHKTFGKAQGYLAQLQQFYQGKPQAALLQHALTSLPDYCNDAEILDHLERSFFVKLDEEALRRISQAAAHNAVAVAASPWASIDMLLSLLRNLQMINQVGQVYGLRPSLLGRFRLFKHVVAHLIGTGASEILLEHSINELGIGGLSQLLGLRLTQGIGAGLYTAKIGLAAITISRPLTFTSENQPRLKHLLTNILSQLKKTFSSGE
jgi:putative membrane protein